MAPRIRHLALDDAAPYRRLAQFALKAEVGSTLRAPVTAQRRILGLPARTPVLTLVARRPAGTPESRLDAA
jgi:hypothetical protein